jgi:peptidoglycan/LPS O-acetylase OafA/YrhL
MNLITPAMQPSTPASRHRFHLLDALRGIAAVIVALWHGAFYFNITPIAHNGPLAVDFFFCLSGFVIAFSYEKRLQRDLGPQQFFIARLIRLYPIYLLGLTAGFFLAITQHLHAADIVELWQDIRLYLQGLFLVPNIFYRKTSFLFPHDNAAWSLFFEFLANAVYAILIYKRMAQTRVIVMIAGISCLLLTAWVLHGNDLWLIGWQNHIQPFVMGIPRTALSFAIGILVLRLYRSHGMHWEWPSQFGPALSLLVTGLLIFTLLSPLRSMQSRAFTLVAVTFIMPVLVFFGSLTRLPSLVKGLCSAFGEFSYPLYLFHMVFLNSLAILFSSSIASLRPSSVTLFILLAVTLISLVSLAVAKWIDPPIRAFLVRKYSSLLTPQETHARQ